MGLIGDDIGCRHCRRMFTRLSLAEDPLWQRPPLMRWMQQTKKKRCAGCCMLSELLPAKEMCNDKKTRQKAGCGAAGGAAATGGSSKRQESKTGPHQGEVCRPGG
eukprot:1152962-Pelagomonas_calceolata.AAC.5